MAGRIEDAEAALLNAPFEPDGWSRAIDRIARACHAPSANLVGLGGPALLPLNLFTGRDDAACRAAFENPALWGDCNWRIRADAGTMGVRDDRHYAEARLRGGTEAYDDVCSDLDIFHGCQVSLVNDGRNFLGLALLRGRRDGPADEAMLARFHQLLRPLQRAVRVQMAMDGEAAELMLGDAHGLSGHVVLIDRHGCLAALSQPAEALFEADGPMMLDGLSPALRLPAEQRLFHRALARLLASDPAEAPVHVLRVGRSPRHPEGRWRMTLLHLPVEARRLGFEPHVAVSLQPA